MDLSIIGIRTLGIRLPVIFFAASDPPELPLIPEESKHVPT